MPTGILASAAFLFDCLISRSGHLMTAGLSASHPETPSGRRSEVKSCPGYFIGQGRFGKPAVIAPEDKDDRHVLVPVM